MVGRTLGVIRPSNLVASYTPLDPGPNGPVPPCIRTHPTMGGLWVHKRAPVLEGHGALDRGYGLLLARVPLSRSYSLRFSSTSSLGTLTSFFKVSSRR
jgi:hypothetical protein